MKPESGMCWFEWEISFMGSGFKNMVLSWWYCSDNIMLQLGGTSPPSKALPVKGKVK